MDTYSHTKDLTYKFFVAVLFSTIFLQKLAIPIGSGQIPISVPVVYSYRILLILFNQVRISLIKSLLFIVTFSAIFTEAILFHKNYSLLSMMYLFVLYIPFIFMFQSQVPYKRYLRVMQNFILITAVLGIFQFIFQYFNLFYLDVFSFVPDQFLLKGYVNTYPIGWGFSILKSNGGGIYLEPSFFSQFLCFSIIVEMMYFKRMTRIFILALGVVFSFSGTGLILLGVFGLFTFFKLRFRTKLLLIILFAIIFPILNNTHFFDVYKYRFQSEISTDDSSFNIRFIAPYKAVNDTLNDKNFFVGLGAGSSDQLSISYYANFTVIPKLLIEYGFFNTILFLSFILYCFFQKRHHLLLVGPLLLMYTFLSGSLLQPHTVFFIYALTCILPKQGGQSSLFFSFETWIN